MSAVSFKSGLTVVSVLAIAAANPATAQEILSQAAISASPGSNEEIVVTAQRRSESLTQVPIAITAITGDQLTRASVSNIRDLATVTPGLRFATSVNALPTIRGIYSRQTDPGNDPNIAIYVDGIYQANVIANNFDLVDIDRIEVLKGPQGTLFGRNATGGAIRIFTRAPTYQTHAFFDLGYGNFDSLKARAYLTGAIVPDKIAASISASYDHADSFDRNVLTGGRTRGVENGSVRAKLLIEPVPDFTANVLLGYASRFDSNMEGWNTFDGNSIGRNVAGAAIPTAPHQIAPNVDPYQRSKTYTAGLTMQLRTGMGTFSSVTSYNKTSYTTNQDADFSSANLLNYTISVDQRDIQQELNFASDRFGMATLTAGLFLFDSNGKYDPLRIFSATSDLYGFMQQKTRAYAGFGELTLNPVEQISVIAGLRYSSETREAAGLYKGTSTVPASLPTLGKSRFTSFTPRASIRYAFESGDNVYATFSQGFKSGGYNVAGLSRTPFRPEKLTAYEIGLKTATRRIISGNVSAFYYNYANQQVQAFVNGLNVTTNAASSHIWGADADLLFRPSPSLTITSGLSYLHARYSNFPGAVFNLPIGTPPCLCGNTTIGDEPVEQGPRNDLSGRPLPDTPTFTISGVVSWKKAFEIGTVSLSGSAYRTSKYYVDSGIRLIQPAYITLGVRASFQPANSNFTIYAWGSNLTNEQYLAAAFIASAGDGTVWSPPRTYGAGARFEF
jgi:iron complex outermembrane receptor protein